jgi:hypothetical protein
MLRLVLLPVTQYALSAVEALVPGNLNPRGGDPEAYHGRFNVGPSPTARLP